MLLLSSLLNVVAGEAPTFQADMPVLDEQGQPAPIGSVRKEDQTLVLITLASTCPVTSLYYQRIKGLWYNYRDKNVAFCAVGGNADDSYAVLKKQMREQEIEFSLAWDALHLLTKSLDLRYTPEAVVIGKNGEILYRGKIDDSWRDESLVKNRYLDAAITAALEGKKSKDHVDEAFMGSHMR